MEFYENDRDAVLLLDDGRVMHISTRATAPFWFETDAAILDRPSTHLSNRAAITRVLSPGALAEMESFET